jgi:AcrR family transcriptional regulator
MYVHSKNHSMTPRTEAQNQALREASRDRLLHAAMGLFARHGYADTSIKMIAAEAGMAQGLLYSHFSGKQELLKAIFALNMADVQESFAALSGDDGRSAAERLIRSAFSILRRNLDFWKLSYALRMQPAVMEAVGPELQAGTEHILRTLEAYFKTAGAKSPRLEAAVLFAAIDGISQHYALDPERYPLDAIAENLIARYAGAGSPAGAPGKNRPPKGGSDGKPRRRRP